MQDNGNIIHFGSIYGKLSPDLRIYDGTIIYTLSAYSITKGVIHSFTKYWACEAAYYNIRVNAICPPDGLLNNHSTRFKPST